MSILIPILVLITSMLIQAFLQLSPGVFSLFYHYSLGKKSKQKTDDLSLSFILGVETCLAIVFLSIFIIISFAPFSEEFISDIFPWIMVGIFLAESVATLLFYYRRGKYTELFLPRKLAGGLLTHAQNVRTRSDAFMLGAISSIPELIFTAPLLVYCISVSSYRECAVAPAIIIILYVLSATIPLFVVRTFYKSGFNLAEIERLRVKTKSFFRLSIVVGFLILAIIAINNGIIK